MADQKDFHAKNQHYVPQFYLRNFSDNKAISLLNLSSGRIIPRASISGQCSEDYFYGKDGSTETDLGAFEEECSKWFRKCLAWDNPKSQMPVIIRCWLARFAAVQFMRSKKNINDLSHSDAENSKTLASLYERDFGGDSIPEQYREKDYSNLPGLSVFTAIVDCGALIDLNCVLLDNEAEEDFVVSDNPVVFQNPLLEKFAVQNCSGFCTRGLQIYYPLSPRRMICLYDADVYKFSGRNQISVRSKKDVESLNNLQFMNADKNIYFKSQKGNLEKYLLFRKQNLEKQNPAVQTFEKPNNPNELLIQQSMVIPKLGFRLSVFKIKPSMLREAYSRDSLFIWQWARDPILLNWVDEFSRRVFAGELNWLEFGKFYEEKLKQV